MKHPQVCAVYHILIFSLLVGCLAVRSRGQTKESAEQADMRATRQLSDKEAELLVDGIKKEYGFDSNSGKLRVTDGKKAESVFESLALVKTGTGSSACSYPSKGDVVSGVIISETKSMVYVDAKPCELQLFSIRKPFTKTKVGTVSCKGKLLDRYVITQH